MPKIMIIDDDPELCTLVGTMLKKDGYEVRSVHDGKTGIAETHQFEPDLILLDVMIPGESGWEICQKLRENNQTPIIFLSARGSESDVVRGLRLGADDYIAKPFRRHELIARIEAVLRRSKSEDEDEDEDSVLTVGALSINPLIWEVLRNGDPIHLTPTEFDLLLLLVRNAGKPLSHDEIIKSVWGEKHKGNLNILKVYIRQLRTKIESNPDKPTYLLTKRGIGYYLSTAA